MESKKSGQESRELTDEEIAAKWEEREKREQKIQSWFYNIGLAIGLLGIATLPSQMLKMRNRVLKSEGFINFTPLLAFFVPQKKDREFTTSTTYLLDYFHSSSLQSKSTSKK